MRTADYFDRAASYYPDQEAFVDIATSGRRTFSEAQKDLHRIANALHSGLALKAGSKVAVYSKNSVMAYLAVLGINRADMIWLPINYNNSLETNIDLLNFFGAECLIFQSGFEDQINEIKSSVPSIKNFVSIEAPSTHGPTLTDLMAQSSETYSVTPVNLYTVSSLNATGGTTGPSKGVQWTHAGLESSMLNFVHSFKIRPKARHLVVAPITHAAGLIIPSFYSQGGATVILPGFNPDTVLETIEKELVTHLFLPPTAIYVLLDHPNVGDYNLQSLKGFISGSAPISPDRFKQAVDVFGPCMVVAYGQTETHGSVLAMTSDDYLDSEGNIIDAVVESAGRPMLGCWVEIMDDDGNILGPNEPGEIVTRGSNVTPGYYENQAATNDVSTFGWHHTTDIGIKDEHGFIKIIGRKKDMVISGGFNIYPIEVESVLNMHPDVHNSAVVGIPDDKWGEALTAVVQIKDGANANEQELIEYCKDKLGSVKSPKSVFFWDSLPCSTVGKVLKREIRGILNEQSS